ncbi:MAG: hypothetical protein HW403_1482, partial [Dehalococcoidia bacterium]|nr:hypothetical protein [Dehalococcoidia bacterium]
MTLWRFWSTEHQRARALLSEHVDGRLPESAVRLVEAHLDKCAQCRSELASLRATVALLQDIPQIAPARSFAITPEIVGASRSYRPPVYVFAFRYATAVSLLLLVVLTVGDTYLSGTVRSPQAAMIQRAPESAQSKALPAEAQAPAAAQQTEDASSESRGLAPSTQPTAAGHQGAPLAERPAAPSPLQGRSGFTSFIESLRL